MKTSNKEIELNELLNNAQKDKKEIKKNRQTFSIPSRASIFDSEIFKPEINDEDDLFVRTIKELVIKEDKPLRAFMKKFKSQMEMNNYKRSLTINSTMSLAKFMRWLEILDYEWNWELVKKKKRKKINE